MSENILIALITAIGGIVAAFPSAIVAGLFGEPKRERQGTRLLAGLILILGLTIGLVAGILISSRACPSVKAVISNRQNIPIGETAHITAIVFNRSAQVFNCSWTAMHGNVPGPPTSDQTVEYGAPAATGIDTITVRVWNRVCYDSGSVDVQIIP